MEFVYRRSYRGPLKAVLLDWAGTTVDFGSFAPTAVFIKLFASRGVPIQAQHARAPMGLMKKDHLRAIARIPEIGQQWEQVQSAPITEEDIEDMFQEFVPMQLECLTEYARPIPGVLEAVAAMRERKLKIGTTTGYTHAMMDVLVPAAAEHGYQPDCWIASDEVPAGRPYPWMAYQNAIRLGVYPMQAFVKIGDTLPDIEEGLNAGTWTIGLTMTGNLLGLTEADRDKLPPEKLQEKHSEISAQFLRAGAHTVAKDLPGCLKIIDEIDERLAAGELP
jgi:phosphonoacetaldehyde hydrolase